MNLTAKTKIGIGVAAAAIALTAGGIVLTSGVDADGDHDGDTAATMHGADKAAPIVPANQMRPDTAPVQQPKRTDADGDNDGDGD